MIIHEKVFKNTSGFFISLSIITLILGFIKKGSLIDLSYFMTFLKVDVWSLAVVSSIFVLLVGVNYASLSFIGKETKKILTITHIILQIISIIPFYYIILTTNLSLEPELNTIYNIVLLFSFVVFILSLVIHLINFFASIFKQE